MTPPLVGFVFMDSLLLGSFSIYRDFLNRIVQHPGAIAVKDIGRAAPASLGSASVSFIAGGLAGWTVSFIAAPTEHIKARLQVQDGKSKYSSPTDCFRKIYQSHGIPGLYRGLSATIIFRSFFAFFWGSYDILNRTMQSSTSLSVPLINFIAAGIAAQLYWLTGYPTDVIKQRIMTGPLGGVTNDKARRLARWKGVARSIYAESGWRGFWRGFLPCFLRAFPANAMSIVTFEAVMRTTTYAKV
jgi:solute carrier family 25 carnitine/acylcarnitine transporter 20/29